MKILRKKQTFFKSLQLLNKKSITYSQFLEGMPDDYYTEIIMQSSQVNLIQKKTLDEKITLYGIPYPSETNDPDLQEEIEKSLFEKRKEKDKNETISLIHLDPTLHLFKKRKLFNFLQDKFVYKGIIDTKTEFDKENPCKLTSPIECLLEPVILEYEYRMRTIPNGEKKNFLSELEKPLDFSKPEIRDHYLEGISQSIQENIEKTHFLTHYDALTHIMLKDYITQQHVYLSDIPAIYYRILIANRFPLEILIEEFKSVLKLMKQDTEKINMQMVSELFFNLVGEPARFFYLRSLIDELSKINKKQKFSVFLRMDRFFTIQKYLEIDNLEHSWQKAFEAPIKKSEEPDERLIEKHALLDVLFESNLWNQPYIGNPFPYISEDYHSLQEEDKKELKKKFFVSYKKFEKIKNEFLK